MIVENLDCMLIGGRVEMVHIIKTYRYTIIINKYDYFLYCSYENIQSHILDNLRLGFGGNVGILQGGKEYH